MFNSSFPRRLVHVSWGWLVALVWYPLALIYRLSLRVQRRGLEHLEAHPGHILVFWHENLGIWFHTELRARGRQVWMQHPALFMTPVHAMLRLMGVRKLAFGSSGSGGKQALVEVIGWLHKGYATVITPDGPGGPARQLKPGALIMAAETGRPIVPVTFQANRCWILPTWDRKRLPKPFSKVVISFQPPVHVTHPEDPAARASLERALTEGSAHPTFSAKKAPHGAGPLK